MFRSSRKYRRTIVSIAFALALMLLINAVLAMEKDNASIKNPSDVADLSAEQSADQYNVTGLWKMIVGETSQYALELRQSGNAITGNIAHVSGLEPIDPLSGFIYPDGKIIFNRTRVGFSPHVYVGIISSSGDSPVMQGNCTYGGAFQYHWIATKANESEILKIQDILAAIDATANESLNNKAALKKISAGGGGVGYKAGYRASYAKKFWKASSEFNEGKW